MIAVDQYLLSLRAVLRHLYDPATLRTSPLVELFGLTDRPNPANALHEILLEAIEALEPNANVPTHSRLWRTHEVLLYRYIQQCGQEEVADQLGISVRHLRREEREALRTLGFRLARRHQVPVDWQQDEEEEHLEDGAESEPAPPANNSLAWLQQTTLEESPALEHLLLSVLEMARGVAAQYRVCLEAELPAEFPPVAVHRVAIRQILLSLLTAAIRQMAGGSVAVSAGRSSQGVQVIIQGQDAAQPTEQPVDAANLEMARQLAQTCGCTLETHLGREVFTATLELGALEQVSVLVIEDHQDSIRLFQRYTAHTPYHLIGVQEVERVWALAEEVRPCLILLDVMMPCVDGWEFLGRLRQHPLTAHLPILVCTILPQADLAFSLGADGFLQKPVSRETLLEALDHHLRAAPPE